MPASRSPRFSRWQSTPDAVNPEGSDLRAPNAWLLMLCLLYTSDAADE